MYSLPTLISHVQKHFLKQLTAPVTLSGKQKEKERKLEKKTEKIILINKKEIIKGAINHNCTREVNVYIAFYLGKMLVLE